MWTMSMEVSVTNIDRTVALYNKVSLWIICAMTLVGLLVMQVSGWMSLLSVLIVSSVFHLVCSFSYGQAWKVVARRSLETLPKLYLASSALRLMAAAIVMLAWCVVNRADIESIKWFAAVFIIYYVVMLVFDAIFFAKVSKNSNK